MTERTRALFRLGRRADAGSAERTFSAFLVAIAAFCMVLSVGFLGVIAAQYQERLEHDRARIVPTWMNAADPVNSGPRWRIIADAVADEPVDIVVVVPAPGAPLPPGLDAWPEPGETVLSPVLAGSEDGDVIAARYGRRAAATIGEDGLVSRTERLAYVRPSRQMEPTTFGYPMTAFGLPGETTVTSEGLTGGAGAQRGFLTVGIGYALGVIVPALILVITSMRAASARRDRRRVVLRAIGARRSDDIAFLTGSLIVPTVSGAVTGLLVLASHFLIDLRLPGNDYILQSTYARAHPVWVLGSGLMGAVVTVVVMLVTNSLVRSSGTTPRAAVSTERSWHALGLPAAVGVFVVLFQASLDWEESSIRIFVIYSGIGLIALSLPAFVGVASAWCARGLVRLGARRGRPSMIVAGRLTLGDPKGVRRLATGLALGIILLAHLMTMGTMTSSVERSAQAVRDEFGDSILLVSAGLADPALEKDAVTDALDGRGAVITVVFARTEDPTAPTTATVVGSCEALTALTLPCDGAMPGSVASLQDGRARFLLADADQTRVEVADPWDRIEGEDSTLYAISRDGEDLPREEIAQSLARRTLPPAHLENIGEMWLQGRSTTRSYYDGHLGVAAVTTLLLALAVAGAALGDADVVSNRAGALRVWGAGRRFALGVSLGRVTVPLLVAGATGALVAYSTTLIYTMPPMNGHLPTGYAAATVLGPALVALLMTGAATAAQVRVLERWRPGRSAA